MISLALTIVPDFCNIEVFILVMLYTIFPCIQNKHMSGCLNCRGRKFFSFREPGPKARNFR